MVVEHDFITTMPDDEAAATLRGTLIALGFELQDSVDGRIFQRPLRESKSLDTLNSNITASMNIDRGRVGIAVQLDTPDRTGRHHEALLSNLVTLLEDVVAKGKPLDGARREWDALEAGFQEPVRFRPIHALLLLGLLGLFVYIYSYIVYPASTR